MHLDPLTANSLTLSKLLPKVILGSKFLFSLRKYLVKCSLVLSTFGIGIGWLAGYHGLNVGASPLNSYIEILTPSM